MRKAGSVIALKELVKDKKIQISINTADEEFYTEKWIIHVKSKHINDWWKIYRRVVLGADLFDHENQLILGDNIAVKRNKATKYDIIESKWGWEFYIPQADYKNLK